MGLSPSKRYQVMDWDRPEATSVHTGLELTTKGITVEAVQNTNQAIVLEYQAHP